jgi:hypothetical protein
MNPINIRVVSFENRTTRTELRFPPRSTDLPAHFLCFLEKGVILELPPRTCAQGHKVQVGLLVKHGKKELRFSATAQVAEVVPSQGERDSVTIDFVGFEQSDWEWIQGIYQSRQADISALFMKLKG